MHDRMPRVFAIGMTPVQPRKVSSTSRTYTHHDQKEHTKQHGARPFYLDKNQSRRRRPHTSCPRNCTCMNNGCHSTANTYQRRRRCSNTEMERTAPLARTVRLLQATMKYCCLERMWRDFAAHMSFCVKDNVRISCAK